MYTEWLSNVLKKYIKQIEKFLVGTVSIQFQNFMNFLILSIFHILDKQLMKLTADLWFISLGFSVRPYPNCLQNQKQI